MSSMVTANGEDLSVRFSDQECNGKKGGALSSTCCAMETYRVLFVGGTILRKGIFDG